MTPHGLNGNDRCYCFVAVKLPVKPRTFISPLIVVSEVSAPWKTKTAGPASQFQATLPLVTVTGVNVLGFPFSQVAATPGPSPLK